MTNHTDTPTTPDAPAERSDAPTVVRITAIAGTCVILALAFWTSFTQQSGVAERAHVPAGQGWIWPVVLDGLVLVATVAGLALPKGAARAYAWVLLWAAVLLSIGGNVLGHLIPTGPMPIGIQVAVACVPPVAVLAVSHLALLLARRPRHVAHPDAPPVPATVEADAPQTTTTTMAAPAIPAAGPIKEVTPALVPLDGAGEEPGGAPADPPRATVCIERADLARHVELWRAKHDGVAPTRAIVAAWLGCSLSTAGRALKELAEPAHHDEPQSATLIREMATV